MNGAEPKHRGSGPSAWRRSAGSILAIMALIYLLMMRHAYFFADRVIFQPPTPFYGDGESILKIPVGGHSSISALHLSNPGADYTILYSHGLAGIPVPGRQ